MCEYNIEDMICLLSGEIYFEPVVASDGHTYEKQMLEKILNSQKCISPFSREPLKKTFTLNLKLKSMVSSFLDKYPEKRKDQYVNSSINIFSTLNEFFTKHKIDPDAKLSNTEFKNLMKLLDSSTIKDNGHYIHYVIESSGKKYMENNLNLCIKYLDNFSMKTHDDKSIFQLIIVNSRKFSTDTIINLLNKIYNLHGVDEFMTINKYGRPAIHYLFDSDNYSEDILLFLENMKINFNISNKNTNETSFMNYLLSNRQFIQYYQDQAMIFFIKNRVRLYDLPSKIIKHMSEKEINIYMEKYMINILPKIFTRKYKMLGLKYILKNIINLFNDIHINNTDLMKKIPKAIECASHYIINYGDDECFMEYKKIINIYYDKYIFPFAVDYEDKIMPDKNMFIYIFKHKKYFRINDVNKNKNSLAHYIFATYDADFIKIFIESNLLPINTLNENNLFALDLLLQRCMLTNKLRVDGLKNISEESYFFIKYDAIYLFNDNMMVDNEFKVKIVFNENLIEMASGIKHDDTKSVTQYLIEYIFNDYDNFYKLIGINKK